MEKTRLQKGIVMALVLLLLVSLLACQLGRAKPTPRLIVVTPTPVSAAPTLPLQAPTQPPLPEAPIPASQPGLAAGPVLDDFEGGDFEARWWSDVSEGIPSFTCALDPSGHNSAQAMRLTFEIGAEGYAGCGMSLDPGQWENVGG